MLNHTGHKCAYCHKPFEPGDDIVVCPDCGAPYHRDCYQQAGDCVFAEKHGTDFEWQPEPGTGPRTDEVICPNCGAKTPGDAQFCKECGAPLKAGAQQNTSYSNNCNNTYNTYNTYNNAQTGSAPNGLSAEEQSRWAFQMGFLANQCDPNDTIDGIPLKDWANFVGHSAPSYLTAFKRMEVTGRKFGFSFSALFFGPLYFFFRKMWKWGLVFFAGASVLAIPAMIGMMIISESPLVAGMSLDSLMPWMELATFANMVLVVVRSMVAVPLYRAHCRRQLQKIREQIPAGMQRIQTISLKGGTSILWAVLFVLAQFTLQLLLISQLFGPNLANLMYAMYGIAM